MKIYNEEKTQELNREELNFEKGYLRADKILVHHDAVLPQKAVYQNREVREESGGISIYKHLVTPEVEGKEAYDDYEDIQVYVPYTAEELKRIADEKRHADLKAELVKIKEDIEQEIFGLVRDDYAEKKARAAEIINELRVLEGKEARAVKA